MHHKYVSKKDNRIVYFGQMGKKLFDESSEAKNFHYIGPMTDAERAEDEKLPIIKQQLKDDSEQKAEFNSELVNEVEVPVSPLPDGDLEKIIEQKKIEIIKNDKDNEHKKKYKKREKN